MGEYLIYFVIGIATVIVGTAIYIGRVLYKGRERKVLESRGRIQKLELGLELGTLPNEIMKEKKTKKEILQTLEIITPKDSLENSSITLLSYEEESKSPHKKRNSKSFNKKVKSKPRPLKSSSANGSKNSSVNGSKNNSVKGSRNGSVKSSRYSSISGSKTSRSVNLAIKVPKRMPPPPPPSPLQSRDNSIETNLNTPSDISEATYIQPISSKESSPILSSTKSKSHLKSHSLKPFRTISNGKYPEYGLT